MAKVLYTEKVICKKCGTIYYHNSYREGSGSICPACRKRNEKCKIGRVSNLKSPILKECQNPNCDDGLGRPFLFYTYRKSQKYCSEKCLREMDRKKSGERTRQWRKNNPKKARAIEKRYVDKKRKEKEEKEKEYYKEDFWKKFMKGDKKCMIEFDEYKGNKMIVLKREENDEYPFKFGLRKAQLILDNFEEIKAWVEENSE